MAIDRPGADSSLPVTSHIKMDGTSSIRQLAFLQCPNSCTTTRPLVNRGDRSELIRHRPRIKPAKPTMVRHGLNRGRDGTRCPARSAGAWVAWDQTRVSGVALQCRLSSIALAPDGLAPRLHSAVAAASAPFRGT